MEQVTINIKLPQGEAHRTHTDPNRRSTDTAAHPMQPINCSIQLSLVPFQSGISVYIDRGA